MHRILPDETKQTESEGDHSSEDIPARNSGTGNPPPGVLFTPIHLPANPGGGTGDRLASIWSLKKVFWVIQEVSELGGMGLPSRVARRQTLMNTSPSRYMNPIPCGVKVNDPGRHHRRRGTGRPRPHVNYPPQKCRCKPGARLVSAGVPPASVLQALQNSAKAGGLPGVGR